MKKLISIIVPIYNSEAYLKKCIDSLINQTYENIEIILVDDQSPDSCGVICDEYSEKDNRIKVIHQKNAGVGKARENGMKIAKGEYITFVDSDDWIDPEFCEMLLEALLKNNADWIACNAKEVDENGNEINSFNNIEKTVVTNNKELLLDHYFEGKMYARVVWGKMFKSSIIAGRKFKNLKICEDTCFIIDIIKDGFKVCLATEYGYNYLRRDNSVTSKVKFRIEDFDYLKGLEYIKKDLNIISPWRCENIEMQKCEVLINMYILLVGKGTKNEKKKYKKKIRREIIGTSIRGGWSEKHLFMIKYMNCLYEILICTKYKLNEFILRVSRSE